MGDCPSALRRLAGFLLLILAALNVSDVAFGDGFSSAIEISREEIRQMIEDEVLSEHDSILFEETRHGTYDQRIAAIQFLREMTDIPEVLRQRLFLKQGALFEQRGMPAEAARLYEEYLESYPNDSLDIEVREQIMSIFRFNLIDGLSAEQRLRKVEHIMSPIMRQPLAKDLREIRVRTRYASCVRDLGQLIAQELREGAPVPPPAQGELEAATLAHEYTMRAKNELEKLQVFVKATWGIESPGEFPGAFSSLPDKDPEYYALAGINHELAVTTRLEKNLADRLKSRADTVK